MKKKFLESSLLLMLGALTSLSLPPLNFFLINFFTFSIFFGFLFKKLNLEKKRYFFIYGWLFGFGYFLTNLYWITIALSFDKDFSYLIPIALIIIPSFLALFYGLISIIFCLLKPKNILSAFFIFSLSFGIFEFIRGTILTGFPWNLIVYSFSENLSFINIVSLIGTYSLNLIVISFFTAPAIYVLRKSRREIMVCLILFILPILILIYGNSQKQKFMVKEEKRINYTIRIIGSNIGLDRFYKDTVDKEIIEELILISSPEKNKKIFFLWPEGMLPNLYQNEMKVFSESFKNNFDENHIIGIGLTKRELKNNRYEFYNSFSVFDYNLNLIKDYNKNKLVPFGEFLPFESFLNKIGLKVITNNFGSFTKGYEREIIQIKDEFGQFKFLPLICYEIIYSGNLFEDHQFDYIFNISEDGWFGKSIGPKQHFIHSIFRAIETGKYVIRSANNGVAAIINPLGEIEQKINYPNNGYIDFDKSKEVSETIFSIYGNKIFVILILLYIFIIFSFNRFKNE